MISFSVINGVIAGTIGETPFSVDHTDELYGKLQKLEEKLEAAKTPVEYNAVLEEAIKATTVTLKSHVETKCPYIKVSVKDNKFYLYYNQVTSDIPMPKALVDRIMDSIDANIDILPLVKFWVRFLRNPLLPKKNASFSEKVFNFVNMKYVHPALYKKCIEEQGLSADVAKERATIYQMKITKEGLLNGYKVSSEVMHKFEADADGNPKQVDRYARTFDVNTGEITGVEFPDAVEDRLFEPGVMGQRYDAFWCEGPTGFAKPMHYIRVGCVHRLESWSQVNTNDDIVGAPGLHVGGLNYINNYSGEIHNVFIDPMHIGAVPDDETGAIRCLQYFVHSSLVGVNGSIYHSSEYAKLTDIEFSKMLTEAVAYNQASGEKGKEEIERLQALS